MEIGSRPGPPAPVVSRVGSTLGDRCVTGRPHKMQSGTRAKQETHNRLKLTSDFYGRPM